MTRHHTLAGLATATLFLTLPLTACTTGATEDPTTSQAPPPTTDPADLTPQQRIEDSFEASDAAAAEGWTDLDYIDEYFTPELAEAVRAEEEEQAETGAIITGETKLSNFSTIESSETTAVVEFCQDNRDLEASRDGEPISIANAQDESVAQFTLTRDNGDSPWLIEEQGYFEEGTTCGSHFDQ